MAREYKDVWNSRQPQRHRSRGFEPFEGDSLEAELDDEADEREYEYLDRERHDHGLELWTLANIFEPMKPGEDTRYQDFHLAIVNNWKVVTFEVGRYGLHGDALKVDINLFAVRR